MWRVSLTRGPQGKETESMRELVTRIFQADFLKGMGVTFRTQLPSNIYTEQYPLERPMVAERFRGAPRLNKHPETGETLCIACNLCALACPENLIVVGWERDDATRRKVLTTFTYDTSRCMFCGLCEDACPTDALELTQDFEMAYTAVKARFGTGIFWKKDRRRRRTRDKNSMEIRRDPITQSWVVCGQRERLGEWGSSVPWIQALWKTQRRY